MPALELVTLADEEEQQPVSSRTRSRKNKIVLTKSTSIPGVTTDGSELRISRVYIPQ
jgi:hypothetical protein